MTEPSIIDKLKNRCPDCNGRGWRYKELDFEVLCPRCHGHGEIWIKTKSDGPFWTVMILWRESRYWLSVKVSDLGDWASRKIWP